MNSLFNTVLDACYRVYKAVFLTPLRLVDLLLQSLLKNFREKGIRWPSLPWYHPNSHEFWPLLRCIQCVDEGVEVIFEGVLTINAMNFFCRLFTGEQRKDWQLREQHKKSSNILSGMVSRQKTLPWYHPHNDYFWGQICDVIISTERTVLVFQGQALHDGFRELVRDMSPAVVAPGGDFFVTSRELNQHLREWYDEHSESSMFNYWETVHPHLSEERDWRQYIIEQARMDVEFVTWRRKQLHREQLESLVNDVFNKT